MTKKSVSEPETSAKALQAGAAVEIVARAAGPEDVKSGLYFDYFAGLRGTVRKHYDDDTVAVIVDTASLPDQMRKRHQTQQETARTKWLDGLSDEARRKLTDREQQFSLSYTLLLVAPDLIPLDAKSEKQPPKPAPKPALVLDLDDATPMAEAPPRRTLAEIEADEQRHLEQRRSSSTE